MLVAVAVLLARAGAQGPPEDPPQPPTTPLPVAMLLNLVGSLLYGIGENVADGAPQPLADLVAPVQSILGEGVRGARDQINANGAAFKTDFERGLYSTDARASTTASGAGRLATGAPRALGPSQLRAGSGGAVAGQLLNALSEALIDGSNALAKVAPSNAGGTSAGTPVAAGRPTPARP